MDKTYCVLDTNTMIEEFLKLNMKLINYVLEINSFSLAKAEWLRDINYWRINDYLPYFGIEPSTILHDGFNDSDAIIVNNINPYCVLDIN